MDRVKEIFCKIFRAVEMVFITVFFGVVAIFLFRKDKDLTKETDKAAKAREEKKNELEKKTADSIAADSPNADTIIANIEQEQKEFRKRVRNRLKKDIQRNGSSSDN